MKSISGGPTSRRVSPTSRRRATTNDLHHPADDYALIKLLRVIWISCGDCIKNTVFASFCYSAIIARLQPLLLYETETLGLLEGAGTYRGKLSQGKFLCYPPTPVAQTFFLHYIFNCPPSQLQH